MPGAGHLYRRGKTWWGRVRVAGVEHRRSLRTTDKKEAAHRLKGWRISVERAATGAPDCPTVKAATIRWGKEILPQSVRPAVKTRYLSSIRQVVDVLGDVRVDTITQATLAGYASARALTTSNATIRRDLTALSRLLACCVAWGYRLDNPARLYDRTMIKEMREPVRPPEPADVALVIAAAPAPMARVLQLLDQTGMRSQEAVQLQGQDISRAHAQIRLTRTKTGRPRTIDFITPGGDATAILASAPEVGAVFASSQGRPYGNFATHTAKVIARVALKEKLARRPFRRFRVHDLRHGFAIRALRAGMSIYSLSRHLGHTSVKTTEIYLDYLSETEQKVAQTGAQTA